MTSVVRVPTQIHLEAKRIAALRGKVPGEVLAEAWREYLLHHRDEFTADLEQAAELMRNGTLEDLAAFAGRDAGSYGEETAKQIREE